MDPDKIRSGETPDYRYELVDRQTGSTVAIFVEPDRRYQAEANLHADIPEKDEDLKRVNSRLSLVVAHKVLQRYLRYGEPAVDAKLLGKALSLAYPVNPLMELGGPVMVMIGGGVDLENV